MTQSIENKDRIHFLPQTNEPCRVLDRRLNIARNLTQQTRLRLALRLDFPASKAPAGPSNPCNFNVIFSLYR